MEFEHGTVGAGTYEKIKHDIVFGLIKPGTKLKLSTLKTKYKASVSTLRETLSRLSSNGYVKAEEQRGFFVTPVSKKDLFEISKLRVLLECHALELSFKNGDTEWEAHVVATHHKLNSMENAMLQGDRSQLETWKRYDREFHLSLIKACDNVNLLALHSNIYDKYLRYQILLLTYRGQDAVDEHQALFEAALARDSDKAKKVLQAHIEGGVDDQSLELEL